MPDDTRNAPDALIRLSSDVDQLLGKYEAFRREHRYAPNASLLLGELDVLQRTLQQYVQVRTLTSREPPRLEALEEVLRQSQMWLGRQTVPPATSPGRRSDDHAAPPDARDQNKVLRGIADLLNECTLTLKVLNATIVLGFAFGNDIETLGGSPRPGSRPVSPAILQNPDLTFIYGDVLTLQRSCKRHSAPQASEGRLVDDVLARASGDLMTEALDRLFKRLGISSCSLAGLSFEQLTAQTSEEYSRCAYYLGQSTRSESKIIAKHSRPMGKDNVTIKLLEHSVKAAEFILFPNRCCWLSERRSVLFEQRFFLGPDKRFPWRQAPSHDALTVSFIERDMANCELVSYRAVHDVYQDSLKYIFTREAICRYFQSALRERSFLGDVETKHIHIQTYNHPTYNSHARFWAAEDGSRDRSVTLLLTTSDTAMHFEDIALRWVDFEKSHKHLKLTIQRLRHDSAAESTSRPFSWRQTDMASPDGPAGSHGSRRKLSGMLTTPFSFRRRSSPIKPPSPPFTLETPPFTAEFFPITISFADNRARDRFAEFFAAPSAVPLPIRSPGSPPELQPVRPQWPDPPSPGYPPPRDISPDPVSPPPIFTPLKRKESMPAPQPLPGAMIEDTWRRGHARPSNADPDIGSRRQFYTPISGNQIRLLKLNPRGHSNMIVCTLKVCDLAKAPRYDALSYCWGPGDNTRAIMLGVRDYRVSTHLWAALDRLRQNDEHRYLWIDALCIDQENISEKNHQIRLMREIYRTAYRTIIWLGNYDMTAPTCPRLVMYPEEDDDPCLCTGSGLDAHEHQGMDQILESILLAEQERIEKSGLADVWWKRLWVVQEFFYSSRLPIVYIGPHAISWAHFDSLFPEGNNPLSLFSPIHRSRRHTLYELLHMTGSFRCSNVRDRVYSLLGMAAEAAETINPDYRMSVLRVMEEACDFLIKEANTLDVLVDSRVDRSRWGPVESTGMPTWIPDLTALQELREMPGEDGYNVGPDGLYAELAEYASDSNIPPSIQPSDLLITPSPQDDLRYDFPRPLKIRALYFDRIVSRTTPSDFTGPHAYEQSPGGYLVYNSRNKRGTILDLILNRLDYTYQDHSSPSPSSSRFEDRPSLGFLILDYLFEGKRRVLTEFKDHRQRPNHSSAIAYRKQQQRDIESCELSDHREDAEFARTRWQRKIDNAERDEVYEPERLRAALGGRDHNVVETDFLIARDFENLFVYARTTERRYYFTGNRYDAPMRQDVLGARDTREAQMLGMELPTDSPLEFHEYSRKHRERDLFRTEGGCLGLGTSSLEVGDIVVMPFGSSRPFILRAVQKHEAATLLGRPLDDGRGGDGEKLPTLYRLVGDAVVANYMTRRWYLENRDKGEEYWLV